MAWLDAKDEVKITKRCLVHFSIRNQFKDEFWCDVVSMDAGHILFGRPWQYDRQIVHDGFNNTYSLLQEGKHAVLLPSKEDTTLHIAPKKATTIIKTTLLHIKSEELEDFSCAAEPSPTLKTKPPDPRRITRMGPDPGGSRLPSIGGGLHNRSNLNWFFG